MSLLCQCFIRDRTIASFGEGFPSHEEKRKPRSSESKVPEISLTGLFATLAGFWEDSAMNSIDEEHDRFVKHLHGCMTPVRSTTCHYVGKKSCGTRSRQNKTRTPEEPSASTHQYHGEAPHTLPVEM
ncbi:hypothetical protein RB195_023821 [Necator americanus]|uniref:Uncharacterized protein n=1 Tax=Necator americanus TaxID=51031 RepID=A0ABR1EKP4_NECAM